MKWRCVEKENPKTMVPTLLCVNNKIADGYYHDEMYWSIMNGYAERVKPSHWIYWDDIPMPEKGCSVPCELCKNRHSAYHIPK
jgi:hypothetical protein